MCMSNWPLQERITAITQIATAILLFVTVVLAVAGDWVRSLVNRPKLKLSLLNPRGHLYKDNQRNYHLLLENSNKSSVAMGMRIMLTMIQEPINDSFDQTKDTKVDSFTQFRWQFQKLMKSPSIDCGRLPFVADMIYAKQNPPHLDFGYFKTTDRIRNLMNTLSKFRMHIQALGDHHESDPLVVEVDWNGQWDENEETMARYLKIKEVPKDSSYCNTLSIPDWKSIAMPY